MPPDRLIASFLLLARENLALARKGLESEPPNHYTAYHIQQAAELLIRAVLQHRRIDHVGTTHNLDLLLEKLPSGDDWRRDLKPLTNLTVYATTYRYPGPSGRISPGPDRERMSGWLAEIDALLDAAADELV